MKRVYESPLMMVEGFEANEYVAACYDIVCNGYSDSDITKRWNIFVASGNYKIVNKDDKHSCNGGIIERVHTEPSFGTHDVEISPVGAGYYWVEHEYPNEYNGHWRVTAVPVSPNDPHPNASM